MNKYSFRTLLIGAGLASSMLVAPSAFANGNCSNYRLSAYGGDGGFRLMSNQNDFRKASNGTVSGKVCQNGRVRIELSKRHPDTHVAFVVNGREYVFGQGDRGDRVVNNWFRRYIDIDLGHNRSYKQNESQYGGNNNKGYGYKNHDYGYNNQNDGYRHSDKYLNGNYSGSSKGGVYYGSNKGSGNSKGYGNGYDSGYDKYGNSNKLNHDHKFSQKYRLPRFAVQSKKHHKAHRKGIPHRHSGNSSHPPGHGWMAYN